MPFTLPSPEEALRRAVDLARRRGMLIPTFAQLADPGRIPAAVQERLRGIGMQEAHPLNLFRIGWKNDPRTGLFGGVNWIELPTGLTGVRNPILALVGSRFPTGAHKVGAAFGVLVPRLVSGGFDPTTQKAVWPSTGNYCRGGVFDCALLGCPSVAVLPEGMSRERFEWLEGMGAEVIRTPGTESNVKEIYDACALLRRTRPDHLILNQFEEPGNAAWHYHLTGAAAAEAFREWAAGWSGAVGRPPRLAAFVCATGSAGTLAAGDFLKAADAGMKVAAVESLQCPTLLRNGYGEHRIEGIGDKHVPWIHNARSTDLVVAVDDGQCLRLMRLFNTPEGRRVLADAGAPEAAIAALGLLGISGIANLVAAIQVSRYYELEAHEPVATVLTDSMELYGSRLREREEAEGPYTERRAERDYGRDLDGIRPTALKELTFPERRALHNLKYYTWVEQQGRSVAELERLWRPEAWEEAWTQVAEWDRRIEAFNRLTGLAVE